MTHFLNPFSGLDVFQGIVSLEVTQANLTWPALPGLTPA